MLFTWLSMSFSLVGRVIGEFGDILVMVSFLWYLRTKPLQLTCKPLRHPQLASFYLFPLFRIVSLHIRRRSFLEDFTRKVLFYKKKLLKRKVIVDPEAISCVFYEVWPKSSYHMFVTCSLAFSIWYRIFGWLRVQLALHRDLRTLFEIFLSLGLKPKSRGMFVMIWHAVV